MPTQLVTTAFSPVPATTSRPSRRELRRAPVLPDSQRAIRFVSVGTLIVWTGVLLWIGTLIFRRHMESFDFSTYYQAWHLIGSGDFNPTTSLEGDFLHAHFELLMWPLGLVSSIYPNPLFLVWIQALALGGCGIVVVLWSLDAVKRSSASTSLHAVTAAAVVSLVVCNPLTYQVLGEDFHTEPLGAFFLLMAAWNFWKGRTVWGWGWVALCLLCGDVCGSYVIGLGLSMVCIQRTRRWGFALMATGVCWLLLISLLHADAATPHSGYAYLAGGKIAAGLKGDLAIVGGTLAHPSHPAHMLASRSGTIASYLRPAGGVGVLTGWGFFVPLVVLVESALQQNVAFLFESFQNVPVAPFVTVGTVMMLVWLGMRRRWRAVWRVVASLMAVATLVSSLAFDASQLPQVLVHGTPLAALGSERTALSLDLALRRTPRDAEVVVSAPSMGRFAARPVVLPYWPPTLVGYPITDRTVVVVVVTSYSGAPVTAVSPQIRWLRAKGARWLVHSAQVQAVSWTPPETLRAFRLPG